MGANIVKKEKWGVDGIEEQNGELKKVIIMEIEYATWEVIKIDPDEGRKEKKGGNN